MACAFSCCFGGLDNSKVPEKERDYTKGRSAIVEAPFIVLTIERGLCGLHLHAFHRSVVEVHREIAASTLDHKHKAGRPSAVACDGTSLILHVKAAICSKHWTARKGKQAYLAVSDR